MDLAHRRFAHPSEKVLRKFPLATLGYPPVDGKLSSGSCSGCAQGKMHQRAYPPFSRRASKPFELIHSDLKSFPVESYHRYKYVIVFYDDYSSHVWISCLRQKSSAISATKQFIAMVNTYYESAVQSWMSDAGGEYKSDAFDNMLRDQGIKIFTSTPHTPQQNGRAERFMRTFMDKAESMRFTACIPQSWWEFSVEYAVQLYNRTPQECLKWSTPFAMLHDGEKPHVDQFCVFSCGAWVLIPQETRTNKLAPKSGLMTYIGQDLSGGIFMHAPNNVVFRSANAQFDETFFPKCPDNKGRKPERPKSPTETHPEPQDDHSNGPKFDDDDAPDNSKCRRTR
jgi:transposase InsO family protein